MNIQRFVLPAILAAAFHAVLLVAIPTTEVDAIIRAPDEPLPRLPDLPRLLIEPVEPVPLNANVAPVRPVTGGGGPPRPALDDRSGGLEREFSIITHRSPRINGPKVDVISALPPGPGNGPGTWGPATPPILSAAYLDNPPRARAQPPPDYPAALRRDQIEGEVIVEFDVDTQGRVTTARIVGSGQREFEQSALRAVLRWRFEPGKRDGRAVPFRMTVPIGFRLME